MTNVLNYYVDTESVGLFSPTVLIQYAINDGPVYIHNLWTEPVYKSLELIQDIVVNNIIGFNLAHDWFHLSRTYNVLQMLPKSIVPTLLDYRDVEDESEAHDKYCLKPVGALDLMLYGRNNEFQATMKQKDICIRRVPKPLAEILIRELEEQVRISPLYFAKREGKQLWKIKPLHLNSVKEVTPDEYDIYTNLSGTHHRPKDGVTIDPEFVNIRLSFHPSTGLKPIMKYLLGKETDEIGLMNKLKRPVEYSWYPSSGEWLDVAPQHIFAWTNDKRRLTYAENDVHYLRDLIKYFANSKGVTVEEFIKINMDEYNSNLSCMVGALHWKGYEVDLDSIREQLKEQEVIVNKCSSEIMFNSPKKVVSYLKEVSNELEKELIENSKVETLLACIADGNPDLKRRAQSVLDGRQAKSEYNILSKLNRAKRLYVTFKVTGTKSNRMSGGSAEE